MTLNYACAGSNSLLWVWPSSAEFRQPQHETLAEPEWAQAWPAETLFYNGLCGRAFVVQKQQVCVPGHWWDGAWREGSSAQHCSSGIRARFYSRVAPVVWRNHRGCLLSDRGFNWMNIFVFQAEIAPWCSWRAQQPPCEPALGGTDLARGAGAAPGQQGLQGMFHTRAHQLTSFAGLTPTLNNYF